MLIPEGPFEAWMKGRGWKAWPFQREAWQAYQDGKSGLVHVATGAGKTYAVYGGPLREMIERSRTTKPSKSHRLQVIYVTPLKALARDIESALTLPIEELGLKFRVETRTGDTQAKIRQRQAKILPDILVTTPESLSLLITRADAEAVFSDLKCVIVDEWHELMTSKRGMLLQLTLSHLRGFVPDLRTWGVSATLDDPFEAAKSLMPVGTEPVVIKGVMPREVQVETILPATLSFFPWAGHLGLTMLEPLLSEIDTSVTNIVFTNTRSQAERWFQAILQAHPEWDSLLALHHGSLAKEARQDVEEGLKQGRLKIVIATSSLDLGVDFPAVERVFQIGSPKALGRFVQRAGRSAHRPLTPCKMTCVPTHAFEILEYVAARRGLQKNLMEHRPRMKGTLDVLIQHLASCALGGGFSSQRIFSEVRSSLAYSDLEPADFEWALVFLTTGGSILDAYPAYRRVVLQNDRYIMPDRRQASLHRMNIGTIESDSSVVVKSLRGKKIGLVDESYATRLKAGDTFTIAGKSFEFIKMYELSIFVKPSKKSKTQLPAWQGTLMPLSVCLASEVRLLIAELGNQRTDELGSEKELKIIAPLIKEQSKVSRVPNLDEILFETWMDRDGHYLFVYPFGGHNVNEAIASVLAHRLSRRLRATFAVAANDYGFVIVTGTPVNFREILSPKDFSTEGLEEDLGLTVDAAQLAKRSFREIARVAGLVPKNYPGRQKSGTAVHVSSSLLYDTLNRFNPDHPLVNQAKATARYHFHSGGRLETELLRIMVQSWVWSKLHRPSPFSFPLVVERVRARLGSESIADRVSRMIAGWVDTKSERLRQKQKGSGRNLTIDFRLPGDESLLR